MIIFYFHGIFGSYDGPDWYDLNHAGNFLHYGCWGQIGSNKIAGKGEPKDAVDKAFRDWEMCRSCIEMDGDGSCEMENFRYQMGVSLENRLTCDGNWISTEFPCALHLCSCDEALANTFTSLWEEFDTELTTVNGFDHAASCLPKPTSGGSCAAHAATETVAQVCCGEYPTRFPFNNKGGCMSCCGAKTYNIYNHSCCDDTIQNLGNC